MFNKAGIVFVVFLSCLAPVASRSQEVWTEDSFEDFADGKLDASGQNLYVSRGGTVRTIHRFDLNEDGYLDLMFNCTHDDFTITPSTLAIVEWKDRISCSPLAVEGSFQAAIADVNKDGYLDAVFCPGNNGVGPRRFVTVIYGGEDGWPAHRSNGALPTYGASRIAIADLNADSWPDIAVLNAEAWLPGQPAGRILRIYWGDAGGYLVKRRLDVGIQSAVDLGAGDFDGDGNHDLAVLASDGAVELLWATASEQTPNAVTPSRSELAIASPSCMAVGDVDGDGLVDLVAGTSGGKAFIVPNTSQRRWGAPIAIECGNASHIAVGDLDGDKRLDLVLTRFEMQRAAGGELLGAGKSDRQVVRILWGGEGGFSADRKLDIPVDYAKATAIGDLNGDGRPDLAVAIHQGERTFEADSSVFFGVGVRRFERSKSALPTRGASHVAIAPAEGKLPARAVFCNSQGGTLREDVDSLLYWGGPDGFKPENVLRIHIASGYESSAADLDCDGRIDLIVINSAHSHVLSEDNGIHILWGGGGGFARPARATLLHERFLMTTNIADLNRDGYLDIVAGQFAGYEPGAPEEVIIYYGAKDGFDKKRRVGLRSKGRSVSSLIADFNQDSWLDIAVNSFYDDLVRVFWGGQHGFDEENQTRLVMNGPIDLETADLNNDGRLDLLVASYHDELARQHDMGFTILWGGAEGFTAWNAQWLPGYTPLGQCVADFDGDGRLDIVSPHYRNGPARESLPCYLYWNGPDGFQTRRRTILIGDSSSAAMAADFNRDGKLDLALGCHTRDGNHNTFSKVFYNDGNRFENPEVVKLPSHGLHWMWGTDIGHIYNRSYVQTYQSSVHQLKGPVQTGRLEFKADAPEGSQLVFSVRSAGAASQLERQPWREVQANRFSMKPTDRWVQYQAVFRSDNGDRYPTLDRVRITMQ